MKKITKRLFLVLSLLFLLGGATVAESDIIRVGNTGWSDTIGFYFKEMAVPPHGKNDVPYSYTLVALRAGSIQVSVKFDYDYENHASNKRAEGYYRDEYVYPNQVWTPAKAGDTLTIAGTWKLKYDWEQYHYVRSRIICKADGVESPYNLHNEYIHYSKTKKNEITASSLPWARQYDREVVANQVGYYRGWLLGSPDNHIYKTEFKIDGSGFESEYHDPEYGIFPMDFSFQGLDYFKKPTAVTWKSGEIRIYSNTSDFDVGMVRYDKDLKKYYRSVPVVPEFDGVNTRVKFKSTFVVSYDGRECTDKVHALGTRYYKTSSLFLPPLPSSSARVYDCVLKLEDFGENESDSFEHEFTVVKTHDYYGPINWSDYAIVEEL